MKIEEISKIGENGRYKCNVCEKEYSRNGISTHYWLNHGDGDAHLKKIHNQLSELRKNRAGKPSWNKGLTAETDERVAKTQQSLRKRVDAGEFMKNRIGVPLKAATKEKLSEARSRFLNESGNGGFKNVKWYKSCDSFGNECSLRGTWERDVSLWLDRQGVLWTRKHYIKYIDDNIRRTYSPDFFVPADNLIIEVKGYYSDKDRKKMQLVKEQHPDLCIKLITKKEFKNLEILTYDQL
jgi:hypothetical protein